MDLIAAEPREVVLRPEGKFGYQEGQMCLEAIANCESDVSRINVDLSKVIYIDSSGIGALINMMDSIPEGCEMRLSSPRDEVFHSLSVCKIESLLDILK